MAVKKLDELLEQMKTLIGENADDNVLSILEDVSDSFNDLAEKGNSDFEAKYNELETKYNELDASWRARYKARFFGTGEDDGSTGNRNTAGIKPNAETITIQDLKFSKKGE